MATRGYCMFATPASAVLSSSPQSLPSRYQALFQLHLSRFQCRRFALAEPPLNLLTTGVPLPNASDHRQTEAQGEMEILHVALAKLDKSLLKQSEEDTFKQIHLMLDGVPVPKHDVRVGPPLIPQSTRGYDIMLSIKFDKLEDFKAYLAHPKHIEILKVFGPSLQDMITYQVDGAASKSKL
ncbi:hypothetical protein LXA43DRAFT_1022230 [Ganoderma leucocontextum]|nr:hypothetical protein LXA43DRAFT_1022230 [Ganoderma leucocontextum]